MESPLPVTLKQLNHALQRCNAGMLSLMLDNHQASHEKASLLQRRKSSQLTQMIESKTTELESLQRKFTQNTQRQRERERDIIRFRDLCESELESMKWEQSLKNNENIQNGNSYRYSNSSNGSNDSNCCNIESVESTDDDVVMSQSSQNEVNIKQPLRRSKRLVSTDNKYVNNTQNGQSKRSFFVRNRGILECSLNDDEIEMDLSYLMDKAMERGDIELPADFLIVSNSSHQNSGNYPKYNNYRNRKREYKSVATSDEDLLTIKSICKQLDIEFLDKFLNVRLYGYPTHLAVYQDILEWVKLRDSKLQSQAIEGFSSGKLRDIQVKLRSAGTVGRKLEMAKGIRNTLKLLSSKYEEHTD